MTFTSLASSSAGNAYLVEDGESRLLIECGLPFRRLRKLLGFDVTGLRGCLITHEHKDHARSFLEFIRSGVPVWASEGTAEALESDLPEILPVREDGDYLPFRVGTFSVLPFRTWHDAKEPVGYLVRGTDGDKLAFATDTVNLEYRFPGAGILAVECNYAADILARSTRLPEKVRERITNSHMEISTLCGYLQGLDLSACRELWLLHLSDACSDEGRFIRAVQGCVPGHVAVRACPKGG